MCTENERTRRTSGRDERNASRVRLVPRFNLGCDVGRTLIELDFAIFPVLFSKNMPGVNVTKRCLEGRIMFTGRDKNMFIALDASNPHGMEIRTPAS